MKYVSFTEGCIESGHLIRPPEIPILPYIEVGTPIRPSRSIVLYIDYNGRPAVQKAA